MSVLLRLVLVNFRKVPLTEVQKKMIPLDGTEMPPNHFLVRWVNWQSEPRQGEMICLDHTDDESGYTTYEVRRVYHVLDRNPSYTEVQLDINTELNLVMAQDLREGRGSFYRGIVLEKGAVDQ